MLSLDWKKRSGENGQALAIVLALLAIGGLTIAVNLNYATTSLKGTGDIGEDIKGINAASAGVEKTLWTLLQGGALPTELSQNINNMSVNMTTTNEGTYTFYLGGLYEPGGHPEVLTISGNLSPAGANRYRYDITITRTAEPGGQTIHLGEIGARLPIGYTYDDSATRSDGDPIGAGNPTLTQDSASAWLVQFEWTANQRPELRKEGGTFVLTFYITGTGDLEGEYTWTVADPTGYGLYGEISGTWYKIRSSALRPSDNRTISNITADIVKTGGAVYILSWQITK